MSEETKQFPSRESLVAAISLSMPDEYPSGFAEFMADDWLKDGKAVIVPPDHAACPYCLTTLRVKNGSNGGFELELPYAR